MKIAFIIYSLELGGAERVVSLLSQELSKEHDVKIILFHNKVAYDYGGEIIDLKLSSKSSKVGKFLNFLKRVISLRDVFKREKFDKVFSFMESANIPATIISKDVVLSVRTNPQKLSIMTRLIMRVLYNRAKKVIVNSKYNQQYLKSILGINNVEVIYNPINIKEVSIKKAENVDINDKYIIALGRLHYAKGFDLLIDAYLKTKAREECKLLIFGEGSLYQELLAQIKALNLDKKVYLMGVTNNPYKYLYNSEFFILSSRYEGFPNVLIEALSCGVATIATDCSSGASDIIEHGENGLLTQNKNVNEMAKNIDKLYFDESLKCKLRANSEKSINHLFIERIAKQWINV